MTDLANIDSILDEIRTAFETLVETPSGILTKYEDTNEPERNAVPRRQPINQPFYRVQVEIIGGDFIQIGAAALRNFGLMTVEVFAPTGQGPDTREKMAGRVLAAFVGPPPLRTLTYRFRPDTSGNAYDLSKLPRLDAWHRSLLTLPFQIDCAQ